ncbi:DUF721 domain-containing protein [Candidatus Babeliales bacterium]|nr:DUF721 domain-containing protein [Candidatus Babeliales bacterium]
MNHIKDFVGEIIKLSNPEQSWKSHIMQNWPTIIGSLASKVFIEKIYQDTVVLAVTDSCWMQELHLLSELLKQKINQQLEKPYITTIRFKYATKKINRVQTIKTPVPFSYIPKPLTAQEQRALSVIKDQELSQALMRFLQKCHHFS